MRGLLLAAAMPDDATADQFWTAFASDLPVLAGLRVHDPFAGGGSTLVEAARLGAVPSGTDVDPLATTIVRHELNPPSGEERAKASGELLRHVEASAGMMFAPTRRGWIPLHWFWLHMVTCPACTSVSALYRSLIIARDVGKAGGVVRDCNVIAFCPDCFDLKYLDGKDRREFRCCGKRQLLNQATFSAFKFGCPECKARTPHRVLQTAAAPRRLLAIEETKPNAKRRIRKCAQEDLEFLVSAEVRLKELSTRLLLPKHRFAKKRLDPRPLSYGVTGPTELFTARQLLVFGSAFSWLKSATLSDPVRRALRLAVSHALTTNNRLCGYATDYGRIAPLFSVRGYSLPALSVELNPFHPFAGRGTLRGILQRTSSEDPYHVRRYVWSVKKRRPIPIRVQYSSLSDIAAIACESAAVLPDQRESSVDICVTDPPYFDYIAYSELSEFYRSWLGQHSLGGQPLLPLHSDPVRSFAESLAPCLVSTVRRLKAGRPLAFTYHSASEAAWEAIGEALDKAQLVVTAIWPIRNDAHMGHHSAAGNCEWDAVVVCRPAGNCKRLTARLDIRKWIDAVRPLKVSKADQRSLAYAVSMVSARFGVVSIQRERLQPNSGNTSKSRLVGIRRRTVIEGAR